MRCLESGYAANVEAVITAVPEALPIDGLPEPVVHDTPGTPTIATLVDWANGAGLGWQVTAADTLKNVLLKVRQPGGEWELLAVGVPGDREVDDKRLGRRAGTSRIRDGRRRRLRQASVPGEGVHRPEELAGQRGSLPRRPADGRRHVVDHRRRRAGPTRGRAGRGPRLHRQTAPSRPPRSAKATRRPTAAGPLVAARGIEIGHIFQLGRKYADAFSADVLGEDGKPVRLTMGSYGVGVSRLVAVIAEQHHDELGSALACDGVAVRRARGDRQQGRRGARRGRGVGRRSGPARPGGAARRPHGLARE